MNLLRHCALLPLASRWRNDSILLSNHVDSLAGRHRFQYQLQLPGCVQNLLWCPHIAKIELTIIGVPFKLEMEAVTLRQNTSTDSPCCCCRSMVLIMSSMGFSPTKEDFRCQPMPGCACDTRNRMLDAVPATKSWLLQLQLLRTWRASRWSASPQVDIAGNNLAAVSAGCAARAAAHAHVVVVVVQAPILISGQSPQKVSLDLLPLVVPSPLAKIELTIIGVPFKLEMEAVTLRQNTSTDSPCCCCRSMVLIMSSMGFSPTKEDFWCQPMPGCACDTRNRMLDAPAPENLESFPMVRGSTGYIAGGTLAPGMIAGMFAEPPG
ncbi:hypothetical protein Pelo_7132 [Pelomyxa schiedti]|nr:hypothetical protein Pelo_7132 [Pelomyxa schiedti]